jgi:hypothetical protein
MNWIKANKFLSGFLAVMLIGVGVLTFLLLSARGRYQEVSEQYETQSTELNRLLSLAPYPDAQNLKLVDAQKKEHLDAMLQLQKNLAAAEIPVEPLTPQQFQDQLRDSVSRMVSKAGTRTRLPEKFYMGFDRYQAEPPRPEAAPILGRDLKAMELVVDHLLENRIIALNRIEREAIPEESGAASLEREGGTGGGSTGRGARSEKAPAPALVKKHTFEIAFVSDQMNFLSVLNRIVSSGTQFFIPRLLQVKNEKEQGPAREGSGAAGAAPQAFGDAAAPIAAAATGAPGDVASGAGARPAAAAEPARKYIVGEEALEVTLRLEIVDFAEPAALAAASPTK